MKLKQLLLLLVCYCVSSVGCGSNDSHTGPADGSTTVQQNSASSLDRSGAKSLWTRDGIDWPSFLGPNRDSKSAETEFNWPSTEMLTHAWTYSVGEGYSSGSVANGRYYHFHRRGDSAILVCLNAETGDQLWEFKYSSVYIDMFEFDGGPRCSPVIDEDRVYIFGVAGMLHCLDAISGDLIWDLDTQRHFRVKQNFFGVGSTPLIDGDLLLVMVGGGTESALRTAKDQVDLAEPDNCAIVAFDKRTGFIKYQSGDDLASYASPVVTEVNGKKTGLAFCRENLIAFNPADGKVQWEFPWRARKYFSVNASTPIVWGDKILITESYGPGGAFLKIENNKPVVVWSDGTQKREQSIACHYMTPVVVDGYAYVSSGEGSAQAQLQCVDVATGEIKWSEGEYARASLLLVDGRLIGLGERGRLFMFRPNPDKFDRIGEYSIEGVRLTYPCWAAPIVSHGYLYLRDKSTVVCLDLR